MCGHLCVLLQIATIINSDHLCLKLWRALKRVIPSRNSHEDHWVFVNRRRKDFQELDYTNMNKQQCLSLWSHIWFSIPLKQIILWLKPKSFLWWTHEWNGNSEQSSCQGFQMLHGMQPKLIYGSVKNVLLSSLLSKPFTANWTDLAEWWNFREIAFMCEKI